MCLICQLSWTSYRLHQANYSDCPDDKTEWPLVWRSQSHVNDLQRNITVHTWSRSSDQRSLSLVIGAVAIVSLMKWIWSPRKLADQAQKTLKGIYFFISTTNLATCVCVCAKFDQFLPVRSHFDTKRPVNCFHISTFPSPTFGPLFAFLCPFFYTKNNNLECRDVLKTVTVTSDQKRFGPYTAHN